MPEGPAKQEVLQQLKQMVGGESANTAATVTSGQERVPSQSAEQTLSHGVADEATVTNTVTESGYSENTSAPLVNTDSNTELPGLPSATATQPNAQTTLSSSVLAEASANTPDTRTDAEPLIKDFLDSFLMKPEDVADPEKVQKYYDELNEKLTKLEQLTQKVAEQTTENNSVATPKQMRQNLSFMEAVNNVFPYIQLPLKFKETPAHGELYVYEKKKALKPSDTLSALLHLELEHLGTTDIFVTLAGNHVTTRFSMTDKESGDLVKSEMPKLTEALAAKGYTLQSEVAVREPEDEATPTLLEQFLEEPAPGGLNRYTFDIRA